MVIQRYAEAVSGANLFVIFVSVCIEWTRFMLLLRLLRKHISLRMVNVAGLAIALVSLLMSASHISKELSWDRYNSKADRIVRMTLGEPGQPVDGRIWGDMIDSPVLSVSGVEAIARLHEVYRPELGYRGVSIVADEMTCLVNEDFFRVFDITMLCGDLQDASEASGNVIVSESMARRLAGDEGYDALLKEDLRFDGKDCRITGIFKDIPETSHWRADVIGPLTEDMQVFCYTYLLLHEDSDIRLVEREIAEVLEGMFPEEGPEIKVSLMPLADIHLHSHNLRELEVNGNITYMWLIVGANALLLIVAVFNLWLNTSLIFSYNRSLYRLLRLHGAPKSVIFGYESLQALASVCVAVAVSLMLVDVVSGYGFESGGIDWRTAVPVCIGFATVSMAVALIPSVVGRDGTSSRFSYGGVRRMLCVQYAVVIAVLVMTIGITRQMNMIENVQAGGDGRDVMVMSGLTEPYMEKYPLLRERLGRNPLIKGMTTCFQIPSDAIRDHVEARCGGASEWVRLPVMIAGDGFLRFFGIPLAEGRDFSSLSYGILQETDMMMSHSMGGEISGRSEEYVINRSAMTALGFASAREAVGNPLEIRHDSVGYIDNGIIVGVTEDYNYTGVFEESIPLVMLHRNLFQFVLMVRFDTSHSDEALKALEDAWKEVYPDCQSDFVFLSDIFHDKYRNEFNARCLVLVFTLLCFLITDFGLAIFMSFLIRRRTKEIAIRKVNGATGWDIARMLNKDFISYVCIAFLVAVPVSWAVLDAWQQRFAYKAGLDWWIFVLSGALVLIVSLLSVSLQSWKAAWINPATGMRK